MPEPWKLWQDVPGLKDSQLGKLFGELEELDVEIDGLEQTRAGVRTLIQELVQPLGHPVRGKGLDVLYQAVYHPPSVTRKLDRWRLVMAGVTAEQLEQGTIKGEKKGYLEVRPVKEQAGGQAQG